MNGNVLIDITQIPSQLSGLTSVTYAIALALLAVLIPYAAVEMQVRAVTAKAPPSYDGLVMRVAVVLACLVGYRTIYSMFLIAAQAMSFAILSEQDWGTFLIKSFSAPDSTSPILSWLTHPLNSLQAIILFLSSLAAVTIKDVMVMLQACFLSLLFAFGPIAVVCGVNEKTAGVTRGWIANSIQIALWSFFLRLVVRVWLTMNPLAGNTGTGWANDFLGILTVNVSFVVLVLGTPVLAARMVSGESIAAFGKMALGAMEASAVGGALKVGRFAGGAGELRARWSQERARREAAKPKSPVVAQSSSTETATQAHDRLFGPKRQDGGKGSPEASRG